MNYHVLKLSSFFSLSIICAASSSFACMGKEDKDAEFQQFDKNGDGVITREEYREFFIKNLSYPQYKFDKFKNNIEKSFDERDVNHNGKIEWEERNNLPSLTREL